MLTKEQIAAMYDLFVTHFPNGSVEDFYLCLLEKINIVEGI